MLRTRLHTRDPYSDFDPSRYPDDLDGWNGTAPIFADVVRETGARLAIEVGSWKGQSAVSLASAMGGGELVCVDTWLGAREFWEDTRDATRYGSLRLQHGYPTVYYTFLANIARRGLSSIVTPLPLPSLIAARVLRALAVRADFVYLDASHDTADVLADLDAYAPLVRPGGILFGDDYADWESVRAAVDAWADAHRHDVRLTHGFWQVQL